MKAGKSDPSGGFTLLELLLSMAITSIIVVMVFGVFRVGIRAWERGERDSEEKHRLRIVTDLIQTQLRSIIPSDPIIKNGDALVSFVGGEHQLVCVSKQSLDPNHADMDVLARYFVESLDDGDRLYYWEQPRQAIVEPVDILAAEAETRHTFLSGMQSIRFQFLVTGGTEEVHQWEPDWKPRDDLPCPRAVNIRILEPGSDVPVQLFIPLPGGIPPEP
jgi:prepilin-type N-terminal cleavage/methylation domain-containing protein